MVWSLAIELSLLPNLCKKDSISIQLVPQSSCIQLQEKDGAYCQQSQVENGLFTFMRTSKALLLAAKRQQSVIQQDIFGTSYRYKFYRYK